MYYALVCSRPGCGLVWFWFWYLLVFGFVVLVSGFGFGVGCFVWCLVLLVWKFDFRLVGVGLWFIALGVV